MRTTSVRKRKRRGTNAPAQSCSRPHNTRKKKARIGTAAEDLDKKNICPTGSSVVEFNEAIYPGSVYHTSTPISTTTEPKNLPDPCLSGKFSKNKRLHYHNSPSNMMHVIPGRQLFFSPSPSSSSSTEDEDEEHHRLLTRNNYCPQNRNSIIESTIIFAAEADAGTSKVDCTTRELANSMKMDKLIVMVNADHQDKNEITTMEKYSTGIRLLTLFVVILVLLTGMIPKSPHDIEQFNSTLSHLTCHVEDKYNWTSTPMVQEEAYECRAIPLGMRYVSTSISTSNPSWILLSHKAADEVEDIVAVAAQIQLSTLSQEQSKPTAGMVKSLAMVVASLLSCVILGLILFYCTGLGFFGAVGMGILVRHWIGKTQALHS